MSDIQNTYKGSLYRRGGYYNYTDNNGQFRARIEGIMPDGRIILKDYSQTIKKYEIPYYKRLLKILQPHFEIIELTYYCKPERDSWCYLNYLRVPNGILLPCLSENALCDNDQAALETFSKLFPDKQIVPIYAKPLLKHGGALHCVTWEYYKNERQEDVRKII